MTEQDFEKSPEHRVEMTLQSLRYGASDLLQLRLANETADFVLTPSSLGDLYGVLGVLGSIAEDIRVAIANAERQPAKAPNLVPAE